MADLKKLLEETRRGAAPVLTPADVDALSGWLCGAANRAGESPDLPRPDHDPVLLQMVYFHLDAALFDCGRLRLEAAGLGPEQSPDRRKTRYRRLAGAFHPDRNPAMADWLTTRSQIILEAYGRFKQAPTDVVGRPTTTRPSTPGATPPPAYSHAYPAPRTSAVRRAMLAMRRRFGHDRHLAHKLIAVLAVLALLPVLNLWLVSNPAPDLGSERSRNSAVSRVDDAPQTHANTSPDAPSRTVNTGAELPPGTASGDDDGSALRRAARQAMTLAPESADPAAPLTPVDRQLEALGLVSDRERLYRRMARAERAPGATASKVSGAESRSGGAEPQPTSAGIEDERPTVEPDRAVPPPNSVAPGQPRLRAQSDSTTESPPGSDIAMAADLPADPANSANAPALQPGDLALGPLTHSEPGQILAGFKQDLESGSLPGIASRFAPDVRHDALRGDSAVTDHYRALLSRYSQRRVDLRARRMRRDGRHWRIEAELVITGVRDGKVESVREGRARFVIGPYGDRIGILRLDS